MYDQHTLVCFTSQDTSFEKANPEFKAAMPYVFAMQGQHRTTVVILALLKVMNLDSTKAGALSNVELLGTHCRMNNSVLDFGG